MDARSLERGLLAEACQARMAMDGISVPVDDLIRHLESRPVSPLRGRSLVEYDALLHTAKVAPSVPVTVDGLKRFHRGLTEGHKEDDRPGQWRLHPTGGRPFEGVPADVVGLFTEELCDWLGSPELAPPVVDEKEVYALIRMLLLELYLIWIRPFNTAHFRLASVAGIALLGEAGMTGTAAHIASIAFQRQPGEFQRQVQQASEGAADPIPFIAFAIRGMNDVLRDLHSRIRQLQVRAQWRGQLIDLYQEGNDEPTRRQRQVLLDLADAEHPVPLGQLDNLSPALARLYAGVSEKTLRRDVDALLAAGVLHRQREGLLVDLSTVLAFKAGSAPIAYPHEAVPVQ